MENILFFCVKSLVVYLVVGLFFASISLFVSTRFQREDEEDADYSFKRKDFLRIMFLYPFAFFEKTRDKIFK